MPNTSNSFFSDKELKNLLYNLTAYREETTKSVIEEVIKATGDLLDTSEKMTPLLTGDLRNSGHVMFTLNDSKKLFTNRQGVITKKYSKSDINSQINKEDISAVAVFDTDYAAYQHEGQRADGSHKVRKYSNPTARKFYLRQNIEPAFEKMLSNIKIAKIKIKK